MNLWASPHSFSSNLQDQNPIDLITCCFYLNEDETQLNLKVETMCRKRTYFSANDAFTRSPGERHC